MVEVSEEEGVLEEEALQSVVLLAKTEQSIMLQQNFRMLALLPEDCLQH